MTADLHDLRLRLLTMRDQLLAELAVQIDGGALARLAEVQVAIMATDAVEGEVRNFPDPPTRV